MRIALAQPDHADVVDDASRLTSTVDLIADAAAAGADVVVLPELVGSGYLLDATHVERVAESIDDGEVLAAWRRTCATYGIGAIAGFAEREGDRLYNAAVMIDPAGDVLDCYRKLHLFGREHEIFSPGDRGLPVVTLCGVRVGIQVCYDLRFPESIRVLALAGADLIAVPTAWVGGFDRPGRAAWRPIGQIEAALVHANLNQVYVACADFVGTSGEQRFLGRSLAVDPYGDVLAGPMSADQPGRLLVEIDPDVVAASHDRGPGISPRANRRTDVFDPMLGYRPQIAKEVI